MALLIADKSELHGAAVVAGGEAEEERVPHTGGARVDTRVEAYVGTSSMLLLVHQLFKTTDGPRVQHCWIAKDFIINVSTLESSFLDLAKQDVSTNEINLMFGALFQLDENI